MVCSAGSKANERVSHRDTKFKAKGTKKNLEFFFVPLCFTWCLCVKLLYIPKTSTSSCTADALFCNAIRSSAVKLISMICSNPRTPSLHGKLGARGLERRLEVNM